MINKTPTQILESYIEEKRHALELAALQPARFSDPAFASAFGRYIEGLDGLIALYDAIVEQHRSRG